MSMEHGAIIMEHGAIIALWKASVHSLGEDEYED